MFWMIQENVTPQGHYITWPGIYTTRDAAERAIAAAPSAQNARAALYQRGEGRGPVPVEECAP